MVRDPIPHSRDQQPLVVTEDGRIVETFLIAPTVRRHTDDA
jgi:hypothetical protein